MELKISHSVYDITFHVLNTPTVAEENLSMPYSDPSQIDQLVTRNTSANGSNALELKTLERIGIQLPAAGTYRCVANNSRAINHTDFIVNVIGQ